MKYTLLLLIITYSAFSCIEIDNLEVIHFNEIDSTQLYAIEHGKELIKNPNDWALISADRQTNGVCLHGDFWVSYNPENIYVTAICAFPYAHYRQFFFTPLVSALSVVQTLEEFNIYGKIKWINDVQINQKKVSGILCEWSPSSIPEYFLVMIGIGLNVNMSLEETFLIDQPATSIFLETGTPTEKKIVLEVLIKYLTFNIELLKNKNFVALKPLVEKHMNNPADIEQKFEELMKNSEEFSDNCFAYNPKQAYH